MKAAPACCSPGCKASPTPIHHTLKSNKLMLSFVQSIALPRLRPHPFCHHNSHFSRTLPLAPTGVRCPFSSPCHPFILPYRPPVLGAGAKPHVALNVCPGAPAPAAVGLVVGLTVGALPGSELADLLFVAWLPTHVTQGCSRALERANTCLGGQ